MDSLHAIKYMHFPNEKVKKITDLSKLFKGYIRGLTEFNAKLYSRNKDTVMFVPQESNSRVYERLNEIRYLTNYPHCTQGSLQHNPSLFISIALHNLRRILNVGVLSVHCVCQKSPTPRPTVSNLQLYILQLNDDCALIMNPRQPSTHSKSLSAVKLVVITHNKQSTDAIT